MLRIFILFFVSTLSSIVLAEQSPTSLSADKRVKSVPYDTNNVTLVRTRLGYQTEILFEVDEVVQNVSIGDGLAWQAVPAHHHLFLKPIASSSTNMTVLTNKRDYNFQLETGGGIQTYKLQFVHPNALGQFQNYVAASHFISCQSPGVNRKYAYNGNKTLKPVEACDDGKFTYLKFSKTGMISAIFSVDQYRNESLINYHVLGQYIVIHKLGKQFTLRHGKQVTSLYNSDAIGDWKSVR